MWQHILKKFEDAPTAKEYYDEATQTVILLHNKEIEFYIDGDKYVCEEGMYFYELTNETTSFYKIPDLQQYQQNGIPYQYKGQLFSYTGIIEQGVNYKTSGASK